MPYSGEASFAPKPLRDVQHFVVMTPKSMTFEAKNAQSFQQMQDAQANIMVATNVKAGQDLSFRVAEPAISLRKRRRVDRADRLRMPVAERWPAVDRKLRPTTIVPEADWARPSMLPIHCTTIASYILGAFALVLLMGGFYIVSRSNRPQPALAGGGGAGKVEVDSPEAAAAFADFVEPTAPARDRNALLLEAMKEELFQLEIDRQQGKLTPEEYSKAKAALDETIKRALARGKSS